MIQKPMSFQKGKICHGEFYMWRLCNTLFPRHRSLVGPGFSESLRIIAEDLPLEITRVPTGTEVFGFRVPKEFKVNDVYVLGPDGKKYLTFEDNHYHVWSHSAPYRGRMSRDELVKHIAIHPTLDDAVPLKPTYYREKWGLAGSKNEVNALPE